MSDFTDGIDLDRGTYEWVKGYYTGPKVDSVMAHASKGLGYIILETNTGGSKSISVAFRRPVGELTDNITRCSNYDATRYEEILARRSGLHK